MWQVSCILLGSALSKMPSGNWVFCIRYFSKTKHRSTKTIMEWCFSCQNKSVCQKLTWSCKKWKSAQKAIYMYTLLVRNPSNNLVFTGTFLWEKIWSFFKRRDIVYRLFNLHSYKFFLLIKTFQAPKYL